MKILGLIMEINPMHNGHQYFIDKAIEITKADYTVCVISPSFTMRADTIILKKYDRCKMLLESKCDVVLEMPSLYQINSADYFAKAAIDTLKYFKVTDICFGVENYDINAFEELCSLSSNDAFNMIVKANLDKGLSYPSSFNKALLEIKKDYLCEVNSSPNNILAISYIKRLKETNIKYHLIQRINNNYHDEDLNESTIQSATSLRKILSSNCSIDSFIPQFSFKPTFYNQDSINSMLYDILKYNFAISDIKTISTYHDVKEGIESRLKANLNAKSLEEFLSNAMTKRYSLNKIKRIVLQICLQNNIATSSDFKITYLRVLGFSKKGKYLISRLDSQTKSMIISSLKELNDKYKDDICLRFEYKVISLYDYLVGDNTIKDEYLFPVKL